MVLANDDEQIIDLVKGGHVGDPDALALPVGPSPTPRLQRVYEAGLLDQYRDPDGRRCVVHYRTGPGEQHVLAGPATSCRPLPEQ